MGSADFFLPLVLPFFVVGAVDGVDVAVDASLVAAAGAACPKRVGSFGSSTRFQMRKVVGN